MRARWWHYVAASSALLCGVAGFLSRTGVSLRDPNRRSCRIYSLENGCILAHTFGSDAPGGLAFGTNGYRDEWIWWPQEGVFSYHSLNDPNATYGSDWSFVVPLWIPFLVAAAMLVPYFDSRMPLYQRRWRAGRSLRSRAGRRELLARGVCPGCRYPTTGLQTNNGSVCPECGSPLTARRAPARTLPHAPE